jgi:hypothetical protein
MEYCNAAYGECDCLQVYLPPRVTLRDAGPTGFSIVGNGLGPNLTVKTLVPGTGVTMSYGPTGSVTIGVDDTYSNVTLSGTGLGPTGLNVDLVIDGTGPDLIIKNLNAGTGILFSDNVDGPVTIYQDPEYSNVTLSSTGNGTPLVQGVQTGPDLTIKSLVGNGIVAVSSSTNEVYIDVPDYEPTTFYSVVPGGFQIPNLTIQKFIFSVNAPIVAWGTHIVTPGNENGILFNITGSYLFIVNLQTSPNVHTVEFGITPNNTGIGPGSQITMDYGVQFGFGQTGYVGLDAFSYRDMSLMSNITGGTSRFFYLGIITTDGQPGVIAAGGIQVKRLH